jgi:hypothetical protein
MDLLSKHYFLSVPSNRLKGYKHFHPTLILNGIRVGSVQYVFHHVVIKTRQLFLRPTAAPSTLLETGLGAHNCKYYQQLNVPSNIIVPYQVKVR